MKTVGTDATMPVTADGGHEGEGTENVLVLAASTGGDADDYCATRVSSRGAHSPSVLLVSLHDPPDRRIDAILRRGVDRPSNVGVVCCDETRSTAAASGTTRGPGVGPGPWIATVPSPGDLTGLSVRIGQALSAWADDPAPVEVCVHTLTTLLQYVDERVAFRFCHAITRHVSTTGASSHFHLDPGVVDERTVTTFSSLFDRVEDRT